MEALSYEYLLRRIYHVGRGGKDGADADVYRKLERAERELQLQKEGKRVSTKSIADLEYDYKIEGRKIWNHVVKAIQYGISKYDDVLSKDEIAVLENFICSTNISKSIIDETIEKAEEIFVAHKIFPA